MCATKAECCSLTEPLCINLLNCQSEKLGKKPSAGSSAGSIPQKRQEQQLGVRSTGAGVFRERSWCDGAGCHHPGGWPARWAGASACCGQPHLLLQRSPTFTCALRLSKAEGMVTCSVVRQGVRNMLRVQPLERLSKEMTGLETAGFGSRGRKH